MKLLLKKCSVCASVIVRVFTFRDPNTALTVWGWLGRGKAHDQRCTL